jgi:hypothetical protein
MIERDRACRGMVQPDSAGLARILARIAAATTRFGLNKPIEP